MQLKTKADKDVTETLRSSFLYRKKSWFKDFVSTFKVFVSTFKDFECRNKDIEARLYQE